MSCATSLAFEKLQVEVLKDSIKQAAGIKQTKWSTLEHEGQCYLCNGFTLVSIPKAYCFIDCNHKDSKHFSYTGLIKSIEDGAANQNDLTFTGIEKPAHDTRVCILTTESGEEICVDKKHIDPFVKAGCTYRGTGKKSMVYCYFGDALVGVVMPLRIA